MERLWPLPMAIAMALAIEAPAVSAARAPSRAAVTVAAVVTWEPSDSARVAKSAWEPSDLEWKLRADKIRAAVIIKLAGFLWQIKPRSPANFFRGTLPLRTARSCPAVSVFVIFPGVAHQSSMRGANVPYPGRMP